MGETVTTESVSPWKPALAVTELEVRDTVEARLPGGIDTASAVLKRKGG